LIVEGVMSLFWKNYMAFSRIN